MAQPRYELKRIGVFSAVKTMFVLGAIGGFVFGILEWAFLGFIFWGMQNAPVEAFSPYGIQPDMFSGALGGVAGVFIPIFTTMLGAVLGVCYALLFGSLYNLSARILGGLTFEATEIVRVSSQVVVPVPSTPAGAETPLPSVQSPPPLAPEPPRRDDDDNEPPRRPSSSMYE